MARSVAAKRGVKPARPLYVLDEQVGFILRQVWQRHSAIFARDIGTNLTPTQWAALSKLAETGPCSQNQLGRLTAMDAATIKGVTDRLIQRGFVAAKVDPEDGRRRMLALTPQGLDVVARAVPSGLEIWAETLEPLSAAEREQFMALLKRLR